jgi:hypothetical protein
MDERERFIPAYGVHDRSSIPADALVDILRGDGWPTYVLPGEPTTEAAFFAAVRDSLPLDPPLGNGLVWDALSDSLWQGLNNLRAQKVAIVWPGSNRLRDNDPTAYTTARDVLADLVFSLADRKYTVDHETRILVLLG